MVLEFEGTIDWTKFQQCLQYVQDSLVSLGSEAAKHSSSTISVFPLDAIQNTVATLKDLMHYRQQYMHNEQAQINRLPSEILSHIFLHLQDSPIRLPSPHTYDRPRAQPIRSRSQASRVCRYWRQVILHTPGLWTMIRVSEKSTGNFSPGMPQFPRHRSWKWAAVSLSRPGTLPVTLQFYIPDINPVRLQKDMPHLMNEAHRIQELQLIRCSGPDLQSFSPVIMKAHRLETLYLMADSFHNHLAPEGTISYECPRLRVLSIGNSTFWRIFTVRELRHLSLAWQEWTSADFCGFLEVLGANPHLEELFLDNINVKKEDLDDVIAFIDHLLPVHLSELERLFIHDYTDAFVAKAYPLMSALHAILQLPFHCTRLNIHENDWHYGSRPDVFDRREAFPVQRLFVTAQFLIGTDGVSACVIGRTRDDNYSLRSIHLTEVRELWLDAPARSRDESPALSAIADMENVTRLVLMRETSFWLEKLERAFPALTEVDVFTQYSPDGPAITQFLANRKRRGLEVTTLRFFGDSASDRCPDFTKWRESPQEFQCHVGRVAFEETSFYAADADLLSERFGLPEACDTPSPFSELWEPWRNSMIKLACKHY